MMENSTPASTHETNADRRLHRQTFTFSGEAGEYFGIWFVNNILTFITLGIYSAWAKVRNTQYFYGNTELAGGNFDFTASPWKILRGRIIAAGLFALYLYSDYSTSKAATIIFAILVIGYFLFAPVITIWMLSFRLRHSQWRGINFRFSRDYRGGYRAYFPPLVVLMLLSFSSYLVVEHSIAIENTLGLDHYEKHLEELAAAQENTDGIDEDDGVTSEDGAEALPYVNPRLFAISGVIVLLFIALLPWFDFLHSRFLARNVHFGVAPFKFRAKVGDYYHAYSRWFVALAVLIMLWILVIESESSFNAFTAMWLLTLLFFPLSRAYLISRRYSLLFNSTTIDNKHQLVANIPFLPLAWLLFSNSVVVALTLGLMTPWAQVRTARYILSYLAIDVAGNLDDFVANQEQEVSALAEEVGDMFDLDLVM